MSLFALVHGGAHGGWCWELVVPELEARGHRAVAPDLPFDDEAGAARWAEVVIEAIDEAAPGDDDVVVVGHSLSGLALPVIASWRPVRHMAFLGAMIPVPGRVYAEYLAEEPDAIAVDVSPGPEDDDEGGVLPWRVVRESFYGDCSEEIARSAWRRLRPQGTRVFTEPCPISTWPDVPSTVIIMTEDRCCGQEWSRRVAKERIGANLIELPGSHSPFYSRPGLLADTLVSL